MVTPPVRTNDNALEESTCLALQLLLRKLRECQPSYLDEDVVHPNASSPSQLVAPLRAPLAMSDPSVEAQEDARPRRCSPTKRNSTYSDDDDSECNVTIGQLVDSFDAKLLRKTRRSVNEVLGIVRMGAEVAFTSPTPNNGPTTNNSRASVMHSLQNPTEALPSLGRPSTRITPMMQALELRDGPGKSPSPMIASPITRSPAFAAAAPSVRSHKCLHLLDQVIQCILVYCNESEALRTMMEMDRELVVLFCKVCLEARSADDDSCRRELFGRHASVVEATASRDCNNVLAANHRVIVHGALCPPIPKRSINEIFELLEWLKSNRVQASIAQCLVDVYALELLLDAALPPAVCSSKYEGLTAVATSKKSMLAAEMVSSRSFISQWMKTATLPIIFHMTVIGLYAAPRIRLKLYDKLTTDGLMPTLRSAVTDSAQRVAKQGKSQSSHEAHVGSPQPIEYEDVRRIEDAVRILLCLSSGGKGRHDSEREVVAQATGGVRGCSSVVWAASQGDVTAICAQLLELLNCRQMVPRPPPMEETQLLSPLATQDASGEPSPPPLTSRSSNSSSLQQVTSAVLSRVRRTLSFTSFRPKSDATVSTPKLLPSRSVSRAPLDNVALKPPPQWKPVAMKPRRPWWLTIAFVESINELLVQVLLHNEGMYAMMVEVVDNCLDHIFCSCVADLLPVILRIVAHPKADHYQHTIDEWFFGALSNEVAPTAFVSDTMNKKALKLTRHLTRQDCKSALPFLTFARRLMSETTFVQLPGVVAFLQRVLLVSLWVAEHQALFKNTAVYGAALVCARLIQPLLPEMSLAAACSSHSLSRRDSEPIAITVVLPPSTNKTVCDAASPQTRLFAPVTTTASDSITQRKRLRAVEEGFSRDEHFDFDCSPVASSAHQLFENDDKRDSLSPLMRSPSETSAAPLHKALSTSLAAAAPSKSKRNAETACRAVPKTEMSSPRRLTSASRK